MRHEVERIVEGIRRAFKGDAWHGPSLEEVLADVTAETAAAHRVQYAHSIWELVLHLEAWKRVVRRRLDGQEAELPPELDFPEVTGTTAADWEQSLKSLRLSQQELLVRVSQLEDGQLNAVVTGKDYSVYHMLHGVTQHDAYHTGQIALLKKHGG